VSKLLALLSALLLTGCSGITWEDDQSATSGEVKKLKIGGLFEKVPCPKPVEIDDGNDGS
jgi:hypothetical protein